MLIIAAFVMVFFSLFYKYVFPTYYYWKLEAPVKEAEKIIKQEEKKVISTDVIVSQLENYLILSPEELNDRLEVQLKNSKQALNKFWVATDTLEKVKSGQTIQRLYNQGSQKSDFYGRYFQIGDTLYIVGTNIPSFREVTSVFLPLTLITLFLILFLLIFALVQSVRKDIIDPVEKLELLTRKISKRDFSKVDLNKENELSVLTESINTMSQSLQHYERDLLDKNNRLKNFSRNLAHELKTPLSIIQLLIDSQEMGIKNTNFIPEISIQIAHINALIERILEFSQQEKGALIFSRVLLKEVLEEEVKYISLIDPNFTCLLNIGTFYIESSLPHLQIIIHNLFTNALKYSKDKRLIVEGEVLEEKCILLFKNTSEKYSSVKMERLLDAFEVGEKSRNSSLSGTGLGFSIVEQALTSLNGNLCILQEGETFIVKLILPFKNFA